MTLNERGQIVTMTNAPGQVSTGNRDALDDVSETTTPFEQTSYTYDNDGNVISAEDDRADTTTGVTYDTSNPNPALVFNQPTSETDALGNTTRYQYNPWGELVSMTDPTGATWTYTYTTLGLLQSETDPLGNTTSYTYDQYGRELTETDPLGGVTRDTYDAAGNVITMTDPNDHTRHMHTMP